MNKLSHKKCPSLLSLAHSPIASGWFLLLIGFAFFAALCPFPNSARAMSLADALANTSCVKQSVLNIVSSTSCTAVTISASDTVSAGTASNPMIPVVIGAGGTLTFKDQDMTLYASSFLVKDGGKMTAGSAISPIVSNITIVMAGNTSASPAPEATGGTPIVKKTNQTPNSRDITVMGSGELSLFGAQGISAVPNGTANDPKQNPDFINTVEGTDSWTYLAKPAGPASYDDTENVSSPVPATAPDTTLTLARKVDWKEGDWISVATTSFASHQTEILKICGVSQIPDPNPQSGRVLAAERSGNGVLITTLTAPPSGTMITISGIEGINGANGGFVVTTADANSFSYTVPIASGAYEGGGQWSVATPLNVTQLTLCQKLKHYHYGGAAPTPGFFAAETIQSVVPGGAAVDVSFQAKSFYDGPERNYGIDERAEVALLSRNIKLTSLAGQTGDANPFTGGHIAIMHGQGGTPTVNLVGIEIEKFGQPLVGRYPFHLHHIMDARNVLIQDVSVHHGYNKCFVVHGSSNAAFYNNVCVRTVGQGVYLEDGSNITGNSFIRNLISGTMAADTTYSYPRQGNSQYWDGDNLQISNDQTINGTVNGATYTGAEPIVITSTQAPATGSIVTITDVTGNTNANGIWTVTKISDAEFSLDGSTGNGTYQNGGRFSYTSNWYSIYKIPDTSYSGQNAVGSAPGPDTFHPGGFWITNLDNVFVNNSVAGCQAQGRGYWLLGQDPAQNSAYPEFTGNRAHGCLNGIDTAPDDINNAMNPAPLLPADFHPITGASNPPVIVESPTRLPEKLKLGSFTVDIAGAGSGIDGNRNVKSFNETSFVLSDVAPPVSYTSGATWTLSKLPIGTITKASSSAPVVITVPSEIVVPSNSDKIIVSDTSTDADGTWKAESVTKTSFALHGSENIHFGKKPPQKNGSWQIQGDISSFAGSSIVITANVVPKSSSQVTISGVKGNTGANGTWTVTKNSATTFSLNGSVGNGTYTSGGTWSTPPQPPVLLLNGNTSTRSRYRGFWGRSIFFALHDNRFGTNPYGVSLAGGGGPEGNLPGYWDLAHDNVFAGMTRNNVDRYPPCKQIDNWQQECTDVALKDSVENWGNYPDPQMNIQGYSYYDGPARIEHNRFVNFRFDPTGLHSNDPSARLLTRTDIKNIAQHGSHGQLEGIVYPLSFKNPPGPVAPADAAPSFNYKGYPGDPATGWIQSNAQSVPPTQYIRDSIWDNVDFRHQVYDESVNMGPFNDGDKTTVILDKDGQLSGLSVACTDSAKPCDLSGVVPVSLNNLPYYATEFTIDEPHSRGPNNFLATSLMSPHRYGTLNIESVESPSNFQVQIVRDMPVYGADRYPDLYLNGRGQKPIYEPFVMDRMGYTVYGKSGTENDLASQTPKPFHSRLLFSYTDPGVKADDQYFVNRIALYQPVQDPTAIKLYRIRRQWGDSYAGATWPPFPYVPPKPSPSCDGVFFSLPSEDRGTAWNDCVARGTNQGSYSGGVALTQADSWINFEQDYLNLINGTISAPDFIDRQKFWYDANSSMLYFYMIEDKPVMESGAPLGTCDPANYSKNNNYLRQIQQIKAFSNQDNVQRALDAACLVANSVPQPSDLFSCNETGCAAYILNLGNKASYPNTNITNVSKTAPVIITTKDAPPTGSQVIIAGVKGNTSANGTWVVTNISDTEFSLNGSSGNKDYVSGGSWTSMAPRTSHPISQATYSEWNQYSFVYGTPEQQPNGLPFPVGAPVRGTKLVGKKTPLNGTPPPNGNRVSYKFQPLAGKAFQVTEDFPYRCLSAPPAAPVNPRGTYDKGAVTYPLHQTVCDE
ncbi:G8 domain-containing protein [Marinobacter sp.]|uniref:G8 domain-containing protein n=1 Tax=Gammaproteobacteria TaxID=1236 RepID=UPI003A8F871A